MPAYAVARLHDVAMGPEIVAYLQKIDATLAPFDGRLIIHGVLWSGLKEHGRGILSWWNSWTRLAPAEAAPGEERLSGLLFRKRILQKSQCPGVPSRIPCSAT